TADQLGRASQVRVTADNTTIIGGGGAKDAIEFRLNQMRAELERATFGIDEDVLNERIGALSGKVAVIRVGAATNAELKELQHRVEDALSATRAAMAEGIVAGGGAALRVVRSALQNGASVAGLLLTTNTLVAEEQTPWGGSAALMTEYGSLDEGLHQPSPDSSTPQSLGLGPSVG